MKKFDVGMLWGVLLIALGLLFLLQTLGWAAGAWGLLWALMFGVGGAVFIYWFARDRANWWAIIPGLTLLGLAVVIALGLTGSEVAGAVGGAVFLGAIGLAFAIIYSLHRQHWWALIPAGVLFTLALVVLASQVLEGTAVGGIFFLGLAATFGAVYLLPATEGRMTWALIPAGVLAAIGVLVLLASSSLLLNLWPLALVAVGIYLIYRALRTGRAR